MRGCFIFLIFSILVTLCMPLQAEPKPNNAEFTYQLTWDLATFVEGKTSAQIAALPELIQQQTESFQPNNNDETPALWQRHSFKFKHFVIAGAEDPDGMFYLQNIRFVAPNQRLPNAIQIGASDSAVRQWLGEPSSLHDNSLIYDAQSNTLVIELHDGKVQAVDVIYYFD